MPFGPSVLFTRSPTAIAPTKAERRAFSPFSSVTSSAKIWVGFWPDYTALSKIQSTTEPHLPFQVQEPYGKRRVSKKSGVWWGCGAWRRALQNFEGRENALKCSGLALELPGIVLCDSLQLKPPFPYYSNSQYVQTTSSRAPRRRH